MVCLWQADASDKRNIGRTEDVIVGKTAEKWCVS
jgi:hypothetical protein